MKLGLVYGTFVAATAGIVSWLLFAPPLGTVVVIGVIVIGATASRTAS